MSWDRSEFDMFATCACGKGKVVRHCWQEDDDWNRSRDGYSGEEILCDNCASLYHIEHIIQYHKVPKWESDGISDRTFLVKNGFFFPAKSDNNDNNENEIQKMIDLSFKLDFRR